MTINDLVLILVIALFLAYAVYDELIMPRRRGKSGMTIALKRRNRTDSLIFVGLVAILLWQNIQHHGPQITSTLLLILAFMSLYIFWFRQPKIVFKADGFFYANVFIRYPRIQSMNLSEDGVLVIQLEQRRLLIEVRDPDDLERIYHFLIEGQSDSDQP
ncbi:hypothetical protein BL250_05335 [Erwinia sp. OLTSP20]|uniref:DUF986 family protein n=1 Tax=unclassified Erwinia TaxID=2622719 RepID=UPI000C194FAB|nr:MULTISPECIES: DUF986 family protein [unclassified Erwinia]PIJ51429.1 hypothetical protein BV501_04170 [Erwinia sp. OAMSP11]PIJ73451.1 hypothetical protein BK416_07005 [Erwinia sp. OLSSP12]PIJ85514.1 hypothetical protein BLD47_00155 [Erwinia sp. OLCASP19]PIJ85912.1 hypothetical protein BLD46_05200 [Erwinia sp. OLMTSP26]PIJ87393.1 hypothetical protein BLD49_06225 [Erwinia sp. OLMDSP33]